jgi:hypothetical protein
VGSGVWFVGNERDGCIVVFFIPPVVIAVVGRARHDLATAIVNRRGSEPAGVRFA